MTRRALGALACTLALLASPADAGAQLVTQQTLTATPICTNAAKTAVYQFVPTPSVGAIVEGRAIDIYLSIQNVCTVPLTIPWRITKSGTEILSGIMPSVPAGQIGVARLSWNAQLGTYNLIAESDPNNSLNDTGVDRMSRTRKSVPFYVRQAPNWTAWGPAAISGATNGFSAVLAQSAVNGNVLGAVGSIPTGGIADVGAYFHDPVFNAMSLAPDSVRYAFYKVLQEAFSSWARGYSSKSATTFPTFATWPAGTPAPPTPGVLPTASIGFVGASSGDGAFSAASLAQALKSKLPVFEGTAAGADQAINDFAQSVSSRFSGWKSQSNSLCAMWGSGVNPTPQVIGLAASPPGPVNGTLTGKLCGSF